MNAETPNYIPWIVMAAIVLISLWWKGYIKLPSTLPPARKRTYFPTVDELRGEHRTADELGVMFAKAKREEALTELDTSFAKSAGDALKASYTAPFAPAAPGPAEPTKPGV